MGDFNDDDVDDRAHARLAAAVNNITGLVPPSIFGTKDKDLDIEPVAPTVRSSATITIDLLRGVFTTQYTWTKEEATLIRDALIEELGGPAPQQIWHPQYPSYPNTLPWVVTHNVRSVDG